MPVDEKVSNVFNVLSGFKEKVRSRIPGSCSEAAERMHINTGRPRDEHEMGTFKSFDRPDGSMAPGQYGEYGEYQGGGGPNNGNPFLNGTDEMSQIDPHTGLSGKITAWQAGWNVTNAIQVSPSVSWPL